MYDPATTVNVIKDPTTDLCRKLAIDVLCDALGNQPINAGGLKSSYYLFNKVIAT